MNRNGVSVISAIERKILEIARAVENEGYNSAFRMIEEGKRNLFRIRAAFSNIGNFEAVNAAFDNLARVCQERVGHQNGASTDSYIAPRIYDGNPGRPEILITQDQLEMLIRENYTAKQMATHFGCCVQSVYKKCYALNIKLRKRYFQGSEEELRNEIIAIHNEFPNCGSHMMMGYLRAEGFVVQRKKVRELLADIDPMGTARRWGNAIRRRTYRVPTPNALWHMDAHLKLVRWCFDVHGCIDGYSRMIVYLKCTNSMTASTVVPLFANAVVKYGLPSRVRADFGYENMFVAMLMNVLRGINRASHIMGRSVHNQRIERFWVDTYKEVIDFFYIEFNQLEHQRLLDVTNIKHMYALQKVYLPYINEKLHLFAQAWNEHKLRTERYKSPRQLWISGMINNINSTYTAPHEVFNERPDLYTRIVASFGAENLNNVIIEPDGGETQSNLTINLQLSDVQEGEIIRIVDSALPYREKYVASVLYLDSLDNIE